MRLSNDLYLPRYSAENKQQIVIDEDSSVRSIHAAQPVLLCFGQAAYGRVGQGEGNAQPLGKGRHKNMLSIALSPVHAKQENCPRFLQNMVTQNMSFTKCASRIELFIN